MSRKMQALAIQLKKNLNKEKRPVSESNISHTSKRRNSKFIENLVSQLEPQLNKNKLERGTSKILLSMKDSDFQKTDELNKLEIRSVENKSEVDLTTQDKGLAYTVEAVYPEQIYYNKVVVQNEVFDEERKSRMETFGIIDQVNLGKLELGRSVSPIKRLDNGKKLVNQSSLGFDRNRQGVFMTKAEAEEQLERKDNKFSEEMKDVHGNKIEKLKHLLKHPIENINRQLMNRLRSKIKFMVKDKTMDELKNILEDQQKDQEVVTGNERARNWLTETRLGWENDEEEYLPEGIKKSRLHENLFERLLLLKYICN